MPAFGMGIMHKVTPQHAKLSIQQLTEYINIDMSTQYRNCLANRDDLLQMGFDLLILMGCLYILALQ